MGLLSFLSGAGHPQIGDSIFPVVTGPDTSSRVRIFPMFGTHKKNKAKSPSVRRTCRVEELEARQMLSASVQFGSTYEDYLQNGDTVANSFEITWTGGAESTTLDSIVISLDKAKLSYKGETQDQFGNSTPNIALDQYGYPIIVDMGNGRYDKGEGIFHYSDSQIRVDANGNPVLDDDGNVIYYGWQNNSQFHPFQVDAALTSSGIQVTGWAVSDDFMTLTIFFDNFTADKVFVFTIDVDRIVEVNDDGSQIELGATNFEGIDMQGCTITGVFTHRDYKTLQIDAVYLDRYDFWYVDPKTGGAWSNAMGLRPEVGHSNPTDNPLAGSTGTAGAFKQGSQIPLPSSISGTVGVDTSREGNNKNVLDNGDLRLQGVQVELWVLNTGTGNYEPAKSVWNPATGQYETRSTGLTTVTGVNGNYTFDGLPPGKYQVREIQPFGFIGNQAYYLNTDGVTYHYFNSNGQRANYLGDLNLVTPIYQGFEFVGTVTDAQNKLILGDNHLPIHPNGQSQRDLITNIVIYANTTGKDYNFLEVLGGSVSGRVYERDTEKGIENVPIVLIDDQGNEWNTVTDENGNYYFGGLDPDRVYTIHEVQPVDYCDGGMNLDNVDKGKFGGQTNPNVQDTITNVTPGSADATGYDFVERRTVLISGFVYEDMNGSGFKEYGDPGIEGVTLRLYVSDGLGGWKMTEKYAVTDANGYYQFIICPDYIYRIVESQPDGYITWNNTGGNAERNAEGFWSKDTGQWIGDAPNWVSLPGVVGVPSNPNDWITEINTYDRDGQRLLNNNFGEVRLASISGYVYEDVTYGGDGRADGDADPTLSGNPGHSAKTNNGVKDVGEKGINGVVLQLWVLNESTGQWQRVTEKWNPTTKQFEAVPGGLTATTATNSATTEDGYYLFTNLRPGTYKIVEVDAIDPVTGEPVFDYLAGQVTVGTVDGNKNDNETVHSRYGLEPTDYHLVTNEIVGIHLNSGSTGINYNFAVLPGISISGCVFLYKDAITILDPNDTVNIDLRTFAGGKYDGKLAGDIQLLSGVWVTLCDASGVPLADGAIRVMTDANGSFIFDEYLLSPGTYTLQVEAPAPETGQFRGVNTPGTLGETALALTEFDIDKLQNEKSLDQLLVKHNYISDLTTLADTIHGISTSRYGDVSQYNNFSRVLYEVEVPPPPPPPPPPPTFPPPPPTPYSYPGPPNMPLGNPSPGGALIYTPPVLNQSWTPGIGGGGMPDTYTWHLSVINAGYPRSVLSDYDMVAGYRAQGVYMNVAWQAHEMGLTQWVIYNRDGQPVATYTFGPGFGIPVAGDFNGDGISEMAVYCNGYWYIDLNGNGIWDDDDLWVKMGSDSDQPVVGDWDGDGKADIGVFGPQWAGDVNALKSEPGLPTDLNRKVAWRPKNVPPNPQDAPNDVRAMKHTARGRVRLDVIDHVFRYGSETDRAVVGDWNGDGSKKIGVYRNGTWYIDYNGNGRWDSGDIEAKTNANPGDIPIVGDFTGEGVDRIGLYTPSTGRVIVDTNGNFQFDSNDLVFYLEGIDDVDVYPVVGDFNGDGIDQIALVKHIEKIPLHTRIIPNTPTPRPTTLPPLGPGSFEAPSQPSISSEFAPGEWGGNRILSGSE